MRFTAMNEQLLQFAKRLGSDLDENEVPVELEGFVDACRRIYSEVGRESSEAFLLTLDDDNMVDKIPFAEWAYYGSVKAYIEVYGDCPQLLVGLAKSCMTRLTPNEEEARSFLDRALSLDPENYWILWNILMEQDPCLWTEGMYKKAGLEPPPWKWDEEVSILNRILHIEPDNKLAILLKEKMVKEQRRVSELDPRFLNKEVSPKYPYSRLYLKEVLPQCADWKEQRGVGD
jgi:tetratricopeptide (TPR) repeat protein